MRSLFLLLGFVGALALVPDARAQDCEKASPTGACTYTFGNLSKGKIEADDLKIEFNSPTVPAGAIIGEDDLALSTIRNSSDLTPQLLAAFNDDGELEPGVAIGGTPYWWFGPRETLSDYRESNPFLRILKRTQIGLATKQEPAKDGTESNRMLVGVSLGWQLLDQQDVRSDYYDEGAQCLTKQINSALVFELGSERTLQAFAVFKLYQQDKGPIDRAIANLNMTPPEGGVTAVWLRSADGRKVIKRAERSVTYADKVQQTIDELTDEEIAAANTADDSAKFDSEGFDKAIGECQEIYDRIQDEQPSLSLNVATALASDEGKLDDLEEQRTSVWLSYKSGKDMRIMGAPVLGFLNYNSNEKITLPDDTEVQGDRLILGVGTSFNLKTGEALDFQASWIDTDYDDNTPDSEEYRITLSYSRKIAENVWMEFKAGSTNSDALEDASFAGISLKVDWAAMLRSKT